MTTPRAPHSRRFALADKAEARAAVRAILLGTGPVDCEGCGERIPPDERESAPLSTFCAGCRSGLALNLNRPSR